MRFSSYSFSICCSAPKTSQLPGLQESVQFGLEGICVPRAAQISSICLEGSTQIPPATKQGAAEELLCSGAVLDKHLSDSERVTIYLCSPISKEKELFQNVLCKELCKRLKILRNPVQRPGERLWKSYLFSSESHGLAVSVGLDAADVMGCGPAQNLHQMLQGALQETKQTQLQQGSSSGICHPPHEAALAKDGFRLRALLQDSSS